MSKITGKYNVKTGNYIRSLGFPYLISAVDTDDGLAIKIIQADAFILFSEAPSSFKSQLLNYKKMRLPEEINITEEYMLCEAERQGHTIVNMIAYDINDHLYRPEFKDENDSNSAIIRLLLNKEMSGCIESIISRTRCRKLKHDLTRLSSAIGKTYIEVL